MRSAKLRGEPAWGAGWPKGQKPGRVGRNIASVRFRWLPRTSVGVRGMFGEDGRSKPVNYEGWRGEIGLNGRNQGGVWGILLPSASVSSFGLPWASATCGRKKEEGRRKMEILRNRRKWPK